MRRRDTYSLVGFIGSGFAVAAGFGILVVPGWGDRPKLLAGLLLFVGLCGLAGLVVWLLRADNRDVTSEQSLLSRLVGSREKVCRHSGTTIMAARVAQAAIALKVIDLVASVRDKLINRFVELSRELKAHKDDLLEQASYQKDVAAAVAVSLHSLDRTLRFPEGLGPWGEELIADLKDVKDRVETTVRTLEVVEEETVEGIRRALRKSADTLNEILSRLDDWGERLRQFHGEVIVRYTEELCNLHRRRVCRPQGI